MLEFRKQREALTMKIGVNTRNEDSQCNNRRDIKQNLKSGNGRHVRIPEIFENKALTMKLGVSTRNMERCGRVGRASARHASDPGSTPGTGDSCLCSTSISLHNRGM